MKINQPGNRIFQILVSLLLIAGCSLVDSSNYGKHTISSSLMDFLYPDKKPGNFEKPGIPELKPRYRVGVAFVPTLRGVEELDAETQINLLQRVKSKFVHYPFIEKIEIIPTSYLKGGKGFDFIDQIARLYDIDIMALVSYDQVINNSENSWSLLYWTVVGMYVIKGSNNALNTFVDTAVFDIKSRKLLFRAPGISRFEQSSSLVNLKKNSENRSLEEFKLAVDKMITNLDRELKAFRQKTGEDKPLSRQQDPQ